MLNSVVNSINVWVAAMVCVCVCVCVFTGQPFDVVGLGVKVDQGLSCVRHYISRSSDKSL